MTSAVMGRIFRFRGRGRAVAAAAAPVAAFEPAVALVYWGVAAGWGYPWAGLWVGRWTGLSVFGRANTRLQRRQRQLLYLWRR